MAQTATATEPIRTLDRALPGWAVDAITDGVPTTDGRKVYGMCVRIAMSAHRRGWTESQYVNEVAAPKSRLWAQVMTRRDGRTSSMPVALKSLRKAWAAGVANSNNVGMRTREEIADDAVELAYAWADRLDAGSDGLSATETAVMRYVVAETERRGMLRVTCPGRAIEAEVGVGYRTATRTLKALAAKGFLVQHSTGRAGEPGKARAAIYGLGGSEVVSHINGGSTPMGHEVAAPNTSANPEATDEPKIVAAADAGTTVSHRDMAVQVDPWWRQTFDDTLREEGYDPEDLTEGELGAVERAREAGHGAEQVAAALIARWETAA
ncbi:hypothetical protein [Rhodococcus sp. NPDC047139]|uniref:hypothetical protein n=1 Tax=Rhodococcus sp. NPDC047139 TaxID=3155141 RepID=UPI0033EC945C